MSKDTWRRYYIVTYDKPFALAFTRVFRDLDKAIKHQERRKLDYQTGALDRKPTGIVRIKGKCISVQRWLYNQCLPGD